LPLIFPGFPDRKKATVEKIPVEKIRSKKSLTREVKI